MLARIQLVLLQLARVKSLEIRLEWIRIHFMSLLLKKPLLQFEPNIDANWWFWVPQGVPALTGNNSESWIKEFWECLAHEGCGIFVLSNDDAEDTPYLPATWNEYMSAGTPGRLQTWTKFMRMINDLWPLVFEEKIEKKTIMWYPSSNLGPWIISNQGSLWAFFTTCKGFLVFFCCQIHGIQGVWQISLLCRLSLPLWYYLTWMPHALICRRQNDCLTWKLHYLFILIQIGSQFFKLKELTKMLTKIFQIQGFLDAMLMKTLPKFSLKCCSWSLGKDKPCACSFWKTLSAVIWPVPLSSKTLKTMRSSFWSKDRNYCGQTLHERPVWQVSASVFEVSIWYTPRRQCRKQEAKALTS